MNYFIVTVIVRTPLRLNKQNTCEVKKKHNVLCKIADMAQNQPEMKRPFQGVLLFYHS